MFSDSIVYVCQANRVSLRLSQVRFIVGRLCQNYERAIEVFTAHNKSYYFIFDDQATKTKFYQVVSQQKWTKTEWSLPGEFNLFAELQTICRGYCQSFPSSELVKRLCLPKLWSDYKIDTFTYLYYLHLLGGRSYRTPACHLSIHGRLHQWIPSRSIYTSL